MNNKGSLASIDDFLWENFFDVLKPEDLSSCTSGTLQSRTTGTLGSFKSIQEKSYSGEFDIYSYLGESDEESVFSYSDYLPKEAKKLEDIYHEVYGTINSNGTSINENYNKRVACVFDAKPGLPFGGDEFGTLKKRKQKYFTVPQKKPSRFNIKNLFRK